MCLNHCKALKVSGRRNMFLQLYQVLSRIVSCFSAGCLGSCYYRASLPHMERKGSCLFPQPLTNQTAAEAWPQSQLPTGLQHYPACTALHITALTRKTRQASALPLQRPSSTSVVFSILPALPRACLSSCLCPASPLLLWTVL